MSAPLAVMDEKPWRASDESDIWHVFCWCDPDRALCGWDVTGEPFIDTDDDDDGCAVCLDLEPLPCERCGA